MGTFGKWLLTELENRNWSQSDLSKRSGLSRGTISNLINGTRGVGADSLLTIAKALNLPPEQIFEAANILPKKNNTDPWIDKISHRLVLISKENRAVLERIIEAFIAEKEKE